MHELFFILARYLKLQYIFQFDGVELYLGIIRKSSQSQSMNYFNYNLQIIFDTFTKLVE